MTTPLNLQDEFHTMLNSLRTPTPTTMLPQVTGVGKVAPPAQPATGNISSSIAPPPPPPVVISAPAPPPVVSASPGSAALSLPPPLSAKRLVSSRGGADTTSTVSQKSSLKKFVCKNWGKILAGVVLVFVLTVFFVRWMMLKQKQKREKKKNEEEAEQIQWENYFEGGTPSNEDMKQLTNQVREGNKLQQGKSYYPNVAEMPKISLAHQPQKHSQGHEHLQGHSQVHSQVHSRVHSQGKSQGHSQAHSQAHSHVGNRIPSSKQLEPAANHKSPNPNPISHIFQGGQSVSENTPQLSHRISEANKSAQPSEKALNSQMQKVSQSNLNGSTLLPLPLPPLTKETPDYSKNSENSRKLMDTSIGGAVLQPRMEQISENIIGKEVESEFPPADINSQGKTISNNSTT